MAGRIQSPRGVAAAGWHRYHAAVMQGCYVNLCTSIGSHYIGGILVTMLGVTKTFGAAQMIQGELPTSF